VLSKYLTNKIHQNTENFWIFRSYINTIKNLSKVANLFVQNPKDFEFVFTIGKQVIENVKTDELNDGSPQSYIKLLRLETLLQKWFYSKLIEDLKSKNQELFNSIEYNIGETHGTALLDISFKENRLTINTILYKPMLQFQGNAVKLAIAGSTESDSKLIGSDIQSTRKHFAEKLSSSTHLFDSLNNYSIDQILKKISTPRKVDGFFSINITENKQYWQIGDEDPLNFIVRKIEQAKIYFKN
jgi:hypothetical protein